MATRCFGRRGFATGVVRVFGPADLRDVVFSSLVLPGLRAVDFFFAAVRTADRDVGLAISRLPCSAPVVRSHFKAGYPLPGTAAIRPGSILASVQPEHAVDGA
jgi:hypothetical protein